MLHDPLTNIQRSKVLLFPIECGWLVSRMFWHCLKSKGPVAFDNSNFALPLAQRLLELGFETDEDNPVWEWKYGPNNLSETVLGMSL